MKHFTIDFIIYGMDEESDSLLHTAYYTMNVEMGNAFTWTENDPSYTLGDINQDGIINILDAVILVNTIMFGGDGGNAMGDINDDGILNILDVVQLVNLILNQS